MGARLNIALPARIAPAALDRADPARLVTTLRGAGLGTSWCVRLATRPLAFPARLQQAIEGRLAQIVGQMSQWEPDSDLSRFNRAAAGAWATLPEDFAFVVEAALEVAARSDGAFDPTHGRVSALLGYGAAPAAHAPSAAALDEAWACGGWRRLEFDPARRRLRQPGGLWLDLSGIAKGFAVDAVGEVLHAHGVDDALVEIGGELLGRGLKPDRQPWWVDIEDPPGCTEPTLRIALHEMAVATSGDYVRGAHTLDPCTGRPLGPSVASVTVLHDHAMLADAWATALLVEASRAGPSAGEGLVDRQNLAARLVQRTADGFEERLSPALSAMLVD